MYVFVLDLLLRRTAELLRYSQILPYFFFVDGFSVQSEQRW